MLLQPGIILQSTETLKDTYFESASIIITENNNDGATGFVINKPYSRRLNELEEFKHLRNFPLYEGGPVDQERLFFIHNRADLIKGGIDIGAGNYFGGDFKQAISCINNHTITTGNIRIFIGYCGWDKAELEEEVNEGSWRLSTDTENIFATE